MVEFILKDQYGKDQKFDTDTIFVQGTNGELIQFSQGSGGGGSSADERVKYVTFVYEENGETKEYSYPVISGDTCRDPVTLGLIDKPIKESTAQYTYEHNGWSLTDGGSASASALTNVTEDRTVYAAFEATLRTYTITYLDSDGVKVLHSETKNYGDMPSYTPEKYGYIFSSWTPTIAKVTGDATYTAVWEESADIEINFCLAP